jgi:aldehyde:ferredoxin oxidoreductase
MDQYFLEIDLATRKTIKIDVPDTYKYLGGRGLTSSILADELDPRVHSTGNNNMLVFAPGLFAGSALSSANRLSAGAKSPLTGGIKESNSGGIFAHRLGRLGIRALKIKHSLPESDGLSGVLIKKDSVEFVDLGSLKGKNTYDSARILLERFGKKCGIAVIGPAGEMKLSSACINVNDMEGEVCRNLGRGGLGAVLGSKGLKAIILDDTGYGNPFAGNKKAASAVKKFASLLKDHPVTGEKFAKFGTVMTLLNVNSLGGLPTRNFSAGEFEGAEDIGAEKLRNTILDRGGLTAHACMPGCVIQCSNKYVDKKGDPLVGSLDYETVCLMGSNLGLSNLDLVAELNLLCNQIGIDTMETGAALGVMAEAGLAGFGDFESFRNLLNEVAAGSPLGRIIGSGAAVCGKVFGVERVPTVKSQAMAAYDPRAIKGMGITYAVSTMGADHTAGNAITLAVDHLDPTVQLDPVRDLHIDYMVLDSLGMCIFTGRVSLGDYTVIEEIFEAFTGKEIRFRDLQETAKRCLMIERKFNNAAGIDAAADTIPEFMRTEKLKPHASVFDIDEQEIGSFYNF